MSILKRLLGGKEPTDSKFPVIEPAKNPWSIPVIDVRRTTQLSIAASENPQAAKNNASYQGDDGSSFIGKRPADATTVASELRYRTDGRLHPGPLFLPSALEQKWAVFFHDNMMMFVRSWERELTLLATVSQADDELTITSVIGSLPDGWNTVAVVDFILRTHVIGMHYPVPMPPGADGNREQAAELCREWFGSVAQCATSDRVPYEIPERPLRSHSLLHVAVARSRFEEIRQMVESGCPPDLLAADGLAPLHWTIAAKDPIAVTELLIELGANVDVASADGVTPLMNAIQSNKPEVVQLLLAKGANPGATDKRGYTALHLAADLGQIDMVQTLLAAGADPTVEVDGKTPQSLASAHNYEDVVTLLETQVQS
jgi:hypothetical protein